MVDARVISTSFVPEVGPWAEAKLECLRKYLSAYTTILRKQRFKGYVYVDAFPGAGTAKIRKKKAGDADNQAFLSARGLGRVDELFDDHPCGHKMNEGQKGLA